MNTPTIEVEELYVCAGICRIDPETSSCIGCGRPVVEPIARADATIGEPSRADSTGNPQA